MLAADMTYYTLYGVVPDISAAPPKYLRVQRSLTLISVALPGELGALQSTVQRVARGYREYQPDAELDSRF